MQRIEKSVDVHAPRGQIEGGPGEPRDAMSASAQAKARAERVGTPADAEIEATHAATEPGGRASGDLSRYDPAFRTDFDKNYAHLASRYEDYEPAYQYGASLRRQHQSSVWSALESDARHDWESRQPGTWERFKDAIRRGWEAI